LTASLDAADRILRIEGTDQGEIIRIVQEGGAVTIEGVAIQVTDADGNVTDQANVDNAMIDQMEIRALAGDDRVIIDDGQRGGSLPINAFIDGGLGHDAILGGSGHDTLVGGAATEHTLAYDLDRDHVFYSTGDDYFNWGGRNEKWLMGAAGWHFITQEGELYRWDGSETASGELLAQLDPIYYEDLSLLYEAAAPDHDALNGGAGTDIISGGDGFDALVADDDDEADYVYGEGDNDTIYGRVEDLLDGGDGENQIHVFDPNQNHGYGIAGPSVVVTVNSGNRTMLVEGTNSTDRLIVRDNGSRIGVYRLEVGGALTLLDNRTYDVDSFDKLIVNLYEGSDLAFNETSKVSELHGGGGADVIHGGHNRDEIFGEGEDDILRGSPDANGREDSNSTHDLIWGGEGNDELYGGYGNDTLVGGNGNDRVDGQWANDVLSGAGWDAGNRRVLTGEAGPANDTIRGGNGNDSLYGGDGNDDLYGDLHNDSLEGGAGLDGLFGGWGDGRDTLNGGAGADRFLQARFNLGLFMADEDPITDLAFEDAQINFVNGEKNWTDEEIIWSDIGLAWLHRYVGNTRLLELSDGSSMSFFRWKDIGINIADNDDGIIRVADRAFTDRTPIDETIVHEIAHNWDQNWDNLFFPLLSGWEIWNLTDNPTIKSGFQQAAFFGALQSWVGSDGETYCWIYKKGTEFANTYGRTDPREDFATCLEAFYSLTKPGSKAYPAVMWQSKWNYIRDWLNYMK